MYTRSAGQHKDDSPSSFHEVSVTFVAVVGSGIAVNEYCWLMTILRLYVRYA